MKMTVTATLSLILMDVASKAVPPDHMPTDQAKKLCQE